MENKKESSFLSHRMILILFSLITLMSSAQITVIDDGPLPPFPGFIYDAKSIIPLSATIPENFTLVEYPRDWYQGPVKTGGNLTYEQYISNTFIIIGPALQSDDRQCEFIIRSFLHAVRTKEDPDMTYRHPYPWYCHHRNNIMMEMRSLKHLKHNWVFEDYVTIKGGKEIKESFNADSLFMYNRPMRPLEQDGEVYKYCTIMHIMRIGMPSVSLAWFFTEKGKENKQHYFDQLSKHIWFQDEEWVDEHAAWLERIRKE